ncbi:hypothetical protein BDV93DRAFT_122800 [Ceratobasidium sp. AG-I]|nr:hypothetical protein BDV93DRAFT_122800 [Ceratobasidium sp. AG-I]
MSYVPSRSARGCLTCKKRRKKCDETKPVCERCLTGGFLCLGYVGQSKATHSRDSFTSVEPVEAVLDPSSVSSYSDPSTEYSPETSSLTTPEWENSVEGEHDDSLALQSTHEQFTSIPRITPLDSSAITSLIPLIIQQCSRLSARMFRPFSTESGLIWRVNSSEVTRWTITL